MNEQPGNTTVIQGLLQRMAAGDDRAREELIVHSVDRLRRLARKMLRENPAVRRWNETDDVLQNSLVRLHRALATEQPENPRRFIGLAATQIRRELIDLWRHHYGPLGDGAHHASDPGQADSMGQANPLFDQGPKKGDESAINLEDMGRFHDAVEQLPDELREVFKMAFYFGMQQADIASAIGVSTKTVKRRWRDARLALQEMLGPDADTG